MIKKAIKKAISAAVSISLIISTFATNISAYSAISSRSELGESGYYHIRGVNSQKYVDVLYGNTADYSTLGIYPYNGNLNQTYKITKESNGFFMISPCNAPDKVLDMYSYDDCSYVILATKTGTLSQYWYIMTNSNGTFSFMNAMTGNNINVYGNNTADETPIISYHPDGTTAEQFDILKLDSNDIQKLGLSSGSSNNSSNKSSSTFCNGTYKVNSWDGVNVRSGAGSSYSWVGTALNGTTFKVSKTNGNWGYTDSIKTNAGWKSGWLCLTYCDIQNDNSSSGSNSSSNFNNGTYKVNSWDGVNVRSGAGTNYSWVGSALNGTTFKVSKTNGDWGYTDSIKTNAGWKSGWLCLTYCNITSDSGNSSQSYGNNGSVSLNVPVMYQNDTRWRSKKLPGSYETIWNVGCMLTGISMMYSYNHNTTVYPDSMMNKLSFTYDGCMYWSEPTSLGFTHKQYTAGQITQSQMKTIYNVLKSGKPVMIGCNNAKGNEHWVVITGYSGDTAWFSPSNFTVNDPMGKFTNLQQHLNYVDRVCDLVY